ncbi:MAG: hypothetical protein OEM97_03110, partial [Acidimicrobiia bacterium]|nr:hypothetical protein [Acidimicrobiia bacterium]
MTTPVVPWQAMHAAEMIVSAVRRLIVSASPTSTSFCQTAAVRPVLTAAQSAAQDAAGDPPVAALMDRAGFAVARVAAGCGGGYGARVAVLAGPGNNGGDGYVAAAYLVQRGAAVSVYPLAE